jgi:hypothetical protein
LSIKRRRKETPEILYVFWMPSMRIAIAIDVSVEEMRVPVIKMCIYACKFSGILCLP